MYLAGRISWIPELQWLKSDRKTRRSSDLILAKLSDKELDALHSDIFLCMSKQRDVLSRQDLVDSGIAMAEIRSEDTTLFRSHFGETLRQGVGRAPFRHLSLHE